MIVLRLILWVSLGLLLYTYVGYPLLAALAGISRRHRKDRLASAAVPTVALVVVARNEEKWIRRRIENALELVYPGEKLQIIIYSDASTDDTDAIVEEFGRERVLLVRGEQQIGQAHGQAAAIEATDAEIVVFSDANTLFEPDALRHLVAPFVDPSVGCVVGSLRYREPGTPRTAEGIYWRYEEWLKAAESRLGACVSGTGAIYAIRAGMHRTTDQRAPSDFYLPLIQAADGTRILYEPRAIAEEEATGGVWAEARRHTRTAEGGAFCLLRVPEVRRLLHPIRFPRLAWQLGSHKVIRWLTALWLLLALPASALLFRQGPVYVAVSAGFAALLVLAAWGLVETLLRRRRLSALPRMSLFFLVVSGAMLVGFIRALYGASRATWEPQR